MRWYLPRSKIMTNKREVKRVAKQIRNRGNYKKVQIAKRTVSKRKGYWVKVAK